MPRNQGPFASEKIPIPFTTSRSSMIHLHTIHPYPLVLIRNIDFFINRTDIYTPRPRSAEQRLTRGRHQIRIHGHGQQVLRSGWFGVWIILVSIVRVVAVEDAV